jgi:hypothetical protein
MINVVKSQPAPECLTLEKAKRKSVNYRCGDVVYRVLEDFYNKCYLCEEKYPSTINVEHFRPHQGDRDLMFDWNNLHYACGHCNNTKLHQFINILDCTDAKSSITAVLKFEINPAFPKEKVNVSSMDNSAASIETAELLNLIYNGKNTPIKIIEGENIRHKVCDNLNGFIANMNDYFNDKLTEPLRKVLRKSIVRELQPDSPFTVFKIWVVKSNDKFLEEFSNYLPQ